METTKKQARKEALLGPGLRPSSGQQERLPSLFSLLCSGSYCSPSCRVLREIITSGTSHTTVTKRRSQTAPPSFCHHGALRASPHPTAVVRCVGALCRPSHLAAFSPSVIHYGPFQAQLRLIFTMGLLVVQFPVQKCLSTFA